MATTRSLFKLCLARVSAIGLTREILLLVEQKVLRNLIDNHEMEARAT